MTILLSLFPLMAGAAATRLARLRQPQSLLARIAGWYVFGVATNGIVLYVLAAIGIRLTALTYCALLVSYVVVTLLAPQAPELPPARMSRWANALFYLPLLVLLAAAWVLPTRDYDGRVTWLPKARAIASAGTITGQYFHGERGLNLHNRYPLLIPLNAAEIMVLRRHVDNEAARIFYAFLALSVLTAARAMLTPRFASAAWVFAAIAWLPVLTDIEGGAISAYADWAVCGFLGLATLSLCDGRDDSYAAFVLLPALVLTKNEGAPLAAAVVVAALITGCLRGRRAFSVAAGVLLAIALLVVWRSQIPAAYDERYEVLLRSFPATYGRLPAAALALLRHACDVREWGVYWIATAIAVAILAIRRNRGVLLPGLVIVACAALYVLVFTVTSWRIEELASVSANRLLTQLILVGALPLCICLEPAPAAPLSSNGTASNR